MDILGVDYGEKYVGLAVGKADFGVATPYKTIETEADEDKLKLLEEIVEQEQIKKIVFGLPLAENREETEMSQQVRKFAKKLQRKVGVDVNFVNEFFTSQEAKQLTGGLANNHEKAAMLILESYLN